MGERSKNPTHALVERLEHVERQLHQIGHRLGELDHGFVRLLEQGQRIQDLLELILDELRRRPQPFPASVGLHIRRSG